MGDDRPDVKARPMRLLRRLLQALGLIAAAWAGYVLLAIALFTLVPPVSTLMLGRWLTLQPVERRFVPLEAVAPRLVASVIASEDARFCAHGGVDWGALHDVLARADEDGPARGASTLTMQSVKNLFLPPSRLYLRKAAEIPLALLLDALWSKRQILEIYLNIAEWGEGVFGIEAAAQAYFGVPAARLSPGQAALLAAALPNPKMRDPRRPRPGHRRLASLNMARAAGGLDLSCLAR